MGGKAMNNWAEQDAQNVSISYEADARFDNAYARVDALTDEHSGARHDPAGRA
jgi:hypothetical protein